MTVSENVSNSIYPLTAEAIVRLQDHTRCLLNDAARHVTSVRAHALFAVCASTSVAEPNGATVVNAVRVSEGRSLRHAELEQQEIGDNQRPKNTPIHNHFTSPLSRLTA